MTGNRFIGAITVSDNLSAVCIVAGNKFANMSLTFSQNMVLKTASCNMQYNFSNISSSSHQTVV